MAALLYLAIQTSFQRENVMTNPWPSTYDTEYLSPKDIRFAPPTFVQTQT